MGVTPASHQSDVVDTPQEKCEEFHKGQHLVECDCSPGCYLMLMLKSMNRMKTIYTVAHLIISKGLWRSIWSKHLCNYL